MFGETTTTPRWKRSPRPARLSPDGRGNSRVACIGAPVAVDGALTRLRPGRWPSLSRISAGRPIGAMQFLEVGWDGELRPGLAGGGGPSSRMLVASATKARLASSFTCRSSMEGWKAKSNCSRLLAPDRFTGGQVNCGCRNTDYCWAVASPSQIRKYRILHRRLDR